MRLAEPHVPVALASSCCRGDGESSALGGRLMCRGSASMLRWSPDMRGYSSGVPLRLSDAPEKQPGESMCSKGAGLGVRRGEREGPGPHGEELEEEPARSCSLEKGGILGGRSWMDTQESRLLEFTLSRWARFGGWPRALLLDRCRERAHHPWTMTRKITKR